MAEKSLSVARRSQLAVAEGDPKIRRAEPKMWVMGGFRMASASRSSHGHNSHDWDSSEYVSQWAAGQDSKEINRKEAFGILADTIPDDKQQVITILDLGAGYGALTKFLLERFPNATAVCQDGSEKMAKLGRERMKNFAGRFEYVICDLSGAGW